MAYANIVLPVPLDAQFSYIVPEPANSVDEKGKKITFKEILSIFEPTPILVPEQLKLWQWMSNYYMTPIGDVYKAAFPSGLKTEDKYKPRTELYITLSDIYKNNEALNLLLNAFGRAKKQQEVLMTYLQLAGVDTINSRNSDSLLR